VTTDAQATDAPSARDATGDPAGAQAAGSPGGQAQTPSRGERRYAPEIARWALGMAVTTARYLTHRVPLYRRNRSPGCDADAPDPARELPGDPSTVQRAGDGVGPLYHRRYEIAFVDAELGCEEIIDRLRRDPNTASPTEVSRFERVGDHLDGPVEVGDEMVVRMPGPWNGPVRVVEATATSFRLATLDGHMEAGEIAFSATTNERGWTVFAIESWARCGDALFALLYHRLAVAREMQLHMWAHFCEQVVKLADGVAMTNVALHSCTDD
jgi:hypothetical protein